MEMREPVRPHRHKRPREGLLLIEDLYNVFYSKKAWIESFNS